MTPHRSLIEALRGGSLPSHPQAGARAATATAFFIDPGIRSVKLMAAHAGGFASVNTDRAIPSGHVRPSRHWFQVRRVHAVVNATQMVEIQPCRHATNEALVAHAMGWNVAHTGSDFAPRMENAVAVLVQAANPQPALAEVSAMRRHRPVLVDATPKAHVLVVGPPVRAKHRAEALGPRPSWREHLSASIARSVGLHSYNQTLYAWMGA